MASGLTQFQHFYSEIANSSNETMNCSLDDYDEIRLNIIDY